MGQLQRLDRDEYGASAVEYGLLVSGIAALIVAMVVVFGGMVTNLFDDSCSKIAAEATPSSPSC